MQVVLCTSDSIGGRDVPIAVRRCAEHVHIALAGGVELAAPAPLDDLGPFVLGHHPLHLKQQMVLGRLADLVVDKHQFHAAPLQFVHQEHLVSITSRQPVGTQHVQAVDASGGGLVAQPLQRRTNQCCAAVTLVDETGLRIDRRSILRSALNDRLDLRVDRSGLRLLLGRDTRVQRRPERLMACS